MPILYFQNDKCYQYSQEQNYLFVQWRIQDTKRCTPFTTSLPKVIWEDNRVAALSRTYAVKSPLVTVARHKCAPKIPLPVDGSPNPATCLMPGPVQPTMPNGIRIRSAVFPQCTGQTDRSFTGKFDDYRPLRYESGAA